MVIVIARTDDTDLLVFGPFQTGQEATEFGAARWGMGGEKRDWWWQSVAKPEATDDEAREDAQ